MTTQEAIAYINQYTWSQWKLGLERVTEMLRRLGDPQKKLRFIHVAGSNGKGSTCAMLERILREAGYTTGFFPSPYIEDFRERIQVCGEWIPEEDLARITDQVRVVADAMEEHPTQFELVTAIGMLYFAERACDIVVLEVGLGGTYDATNVIDAPEVAEILHIGLEHTDYLGSTLTEIAGNKCGIIKPGCTVVCHPNEEETMRVVRHVCEEKGCALHEVHENDGIPLEESLRGQRFRSARTGEIYDLRLLGTYQITNAATVLAVIDTLREQGWKIPDAAVHTGLAKVEWPARFEVLSEDPLFILDGGHNAQCAEALAESIRTYLLNPDESKTVDDHSNGEVKEDASEKRTVVFLMGMLGDKDVDAVIEIMRPLGETFVCVTPNSERALPAEDLAGKLTKAGAKAIAAGCVSEGISKALALAAEKNLPVVAFGSLYMAGEIRKSLPSILNGNRATNGEDGALE